MEIWNDIVSFFMSVWAYVEPYWTYINDFMGQTHTHNLWWFFGIFFVSFMIGRMTKKVSTKIEYRDRVQEKVVYKDKIVEKTVEVCPTNCILVTANKFYGQIVVDYLEPESLEEQSKMLVERQKALQDCIKLAMDIHKATKGATNESA